MDIGGDALLNAAKSGNYEIVRLLIDWGVDINSQVLSVCFIYISKEHIFIAHFEVYRF